MPIQQTFVTRDEECGTLVVLCDKKPLISIQVCKSQRSRFEFKSRGSAMFLEKEGSIAATFDVKNFTGQNQMFRLKVNDVLINKQDLLRPFEHAVIKSNQFTDKEILFTPKGEGMSTGESKESNVPGAKVEIWIGTERPGEGDLEWTIANPIPDDYLSYDCKDAFGDESGPEPEPEVVESESAGGAGGLGDDWTDEGVPNEPVYKVDVSEGKAVDAVKIKLIPFKEKQSLTFGFEVMMCAKLPKYSKPKRVRYTGGGIFDSDDDDW